MLRLVGSRYHFRRIIPSPLRPVLGKSEIWISLGTAGKVEARRRAAELHAQTTDLFRSLRSVSPSQTTPKVSPSQDAPDTNLRLVTYMQELGLRTAEDLSHALLDDHRDMLAQQERIRQSDVEAAELAGKAQYYGSVLDHARDTAMYQETLEKVIAVALDQQAKLTELAKRAVRESQTTQAEKKILEAEISRLHDTLVRTLTKAIESTTAKSAPVISTPQPEVMPAEISGTVPATPPNTKPPVLLSAALKRFLNSKPA